MHSEQWMWATEQDVAGEDSIRRFGRKSLSLALSIALAAFAASQPSRADSAQPHGGNIPAPTARKSANAKTTDAPQVLTVLNCSDHDPGSLRSIVEDTVNTHSGDIVDLSQLPTLCGAVDSRITLSTGEIKIAQDALRLQGPPATSGTVTISGGNASRIMMHTGYQNLELMDLSITEGSAVDALGVVRGGCIASAGSVRLTNVTVADCTASGEFAFGGGISAQYDISLVASTLSGNLAEGSQLAEGGGAYAQGNLLSKYTSIEGNKTIAPVDYNLAGGVIAFGGVSIYHTSVINNESSLAAAFGTVSSAHVVNSTISGNISNRTTVLVSAGNSASLDISNSTIAFNHNATGAAVEFDGAQASDQFTSYSSIIAMNTIDPGNTPADVFVWPGYTLAGQDNAIMGSNVSPAMGVITVTTDPRLGPLQRGAGNMSFHTPLPDSPVLGKGNNLRTFPPNDQNIHDQRGAGYPRTTTIAGATSVDIGAIQFDRIFVDGFH